MEKNFLLRFIYPTCHGFYFSEKKTELGLQVGFRNLCILNSIKNELYGPSTGDKMTFIANRLASLVFHPCGWEMTPGSPTGDDAGKGCVR